MNIPQEQTTSLRVEPEEQTPLIPTVVRDVGAFLGSLALAYFSGWSTRDLVWSLWLSSLVAGFLYFLIGFISPIAQKNKTILERILAFIGGLYTLAFFSAHFGAFHYIHGSILDLFMPLVEQPNRVYLGNLTWRGATPFSFFGTIALALQGYWSFVVLNLAYDYKLFFPGIKKINQFTPYKNVIKLHFLLFAFGALYAIGLESYIVFALVFFVYFAPVSLWSLMFRSKKEQSTTKK